MINKTYDFQVNHCGKLINLYIIGDIHYGSEAFFREKWDSLAEIIKKDRNAHTIVLGDLTDEDRPSTRMRRKTMFSDRQEAFQQEDLEHMNYLDRTVIPELLKVINPKKCFGIFDGDHYRQYSTGLTSTQYVCAKIKAPYLADGEADIDLNFIYGKSQGRTISINARHGKGASKTPALNLRRVEDISKSYEGFDLFLRGHCHQPGIISGERYVRDKHAHITKTRSILLVNTCSFRKGRVEGRTDYAEQAEYPPTSYYLPIIKFVGNKLSKNNDHFKVVMDNEQKYL